MQTEKARAHGMLTDDRIARRSLHLDLAARIREMIIDGSLPASGKIDERMLCDRFGVSRTPLREALKVLAAERLVELTPNRGARVLPLTLDTLEAAFPVMGALEALAGELACLHVTEAQIVHLRELHAAMKTAHADDDRARYYPLNDRFHGILDEAAQNPILSEYKAQLQRRVSASRRQASIDGGRWAQAIAEHGAIVEALAARDAQRLSTLLRRHIANKLTALRGLFRDDA